MSDKNTFRFVKELPKEKAYDLIVAGGGPAGAVAALAGAREGLSVLLVEATGALGGIGTNGFVSSWYCMGNNVHSVVGGIVVEICEQLYSRGAIEPGCGPERWQRTKRGFGFDPEKLKILLDELCCDAGVEVRFATRVVDAHVDASAHSVHGVILHSIEGFCYVPTLACIDATGDAVLTDICGFKCREAGRDTDKIMPPTLCARICGVDYNRFDRRRDQQAAVDQAVSDGFFTQADRHVPGVFRTGEWSAIMNAGHLFDTDGLSVRSLTEGYVKGRKLAAEYTEFFRRYLKGCEDVTNVATANLLGIRESRRIVGEYELDWEDFKIRRKFPDQIAIYCKQIDIHVYDTTPDEYERFKNEFDERGRPADGEYYGVPYGILVPKGSYNLWAAGRCVSTDVSVNGALRDQPGCMLMGQAAGTAAAQHVRTKQPACDLDTRVLVETLRAQGGNLPQRQLQDSMTR